MVSLKKVLAKLSLSVCPAGTIVAYSGSTAPSGWLLCNGGTFSSSQYPKLYEVLGSTTLPDLRDRFIVGGGSTYTLKATGGEATHKLTTSEMPAHTHSGLVTAGALYNTKSGSDLGATWCGGVSKYSSDSTGGGAAHNNLPPYYALTYIISTGGIA